MNTPRANQAGGPGAPARLYLASGAASGLGVAALAFCLPLASYYRASPELFAGSAFALFFLARLAAAPLAGPLSRAVGANRLLTLCLGACALCPLLYALSPTLAALAAVQGLLGLASGLGRPVLLSLAAAHAQDREKLFRLFAVASNAAFFAGPLVGGVLFLERDASMVLGFTALAHAAALALAWTAGKTPPPAVRLPDSSGGCAPRPHDDASPAPALAAVFGRTAGAGAWAAFFPILLAQRIPGDPPLFGFLAGLPFLAACAFTPLAARLFAKASRRTLALSGMLLSALCLVSASFAASPEAFALAALALGVGTALSLPSALSLAAGREAAPGRFGLAQAVAGAGLAFGPLAGAFLVRFVFDAGSSLAWMGALGAACCLPLALSLRVAGSWKAVAPALCALAAVALLPLATAGNAPGALPGKNLHRFAGMAMGTVLTLTVEADSPRVAERAAQGAFTEIRELQADLDHRSPDGSVGQVNHEAGRRPVAVSAFAFELISRALKVCADTDGALDITIGAVSTRPLYYAKVDDAASRLVDYRLVRLDADKRTVSLPRKGMALDLGAVAKGAILDRALRAALDRGAVSVLAEGGGDFACAGGRTWSVGVQHPRKDEVMGVMRLDRGGVCGSGDYRRSLADPADPSRRLHHIIDPKTMRPAQASIGVTAVAPDAWMADALATALFILGPEKGMELLRDKYPEVSAQWVLPGLETVESPGFPPLESR